MKVKCDILYSCRLDGVGVHDTRFKERNRLILPQRCCGQTASTGSRAQQSSPLKPQKAEAHVKGYLS